MELNLASSEDIKEINRRLFELTKVSNLEIDENLFSLMVEMLRDGVHPDTIFAFLKKAYKNTKSWKKYQHLKQKRDRKTVLPEKK